MYWLAMLPLTMMTVACSNTSTTTTTNDSTVSGNLKEAGDNVKDATNVAATNIKQSTDTAISNIKRKITGNPDSEFVVNAVNINKNEIILLNAGIKMGTTKDLKAHAKMMLTDHNKLMAKLQDYAKTKQYPTLTKDWAGKDLSNISTKSGSNWDKAWTGKMIDGHKDDVNIFEDARNKVNDNEIKAIIDNTLPTLHAHLDMMESLKNQLNK
jgi:putative membrane protein